MADKRDMGRVFRQRLQEAIETRRMNRAQLSARAGIDRSTLTQLMASETARLPRADTVAALASALQVSLDWLLGLSNEQGAGAAVLQEQFEITPRPRSPVDTHLQRWHEEAVGYKIRYVPTNIPDLVKTSEIIEHEYRDHAAKTTDQALAATKGKLAYARLPDADVEICVSRQAIEGFVRGEGIWRGLDEFSRGRQVEHMIALVEERYPTLRVYMFDGLEHYSAPYTVFGPHRAAVFMGQMYFVFTTTEHIRALTAHFDELIRTAVIPASDMAAFLRTLRLMWN